MLTICLGILEVLGYSMFDRNSAVDFEYDIQNLTADRLYQDLDQI